MQIRQQGRQTWLFDGPLGIIGQAAVAGPREGQGPLAADFDQIFDNLRLKQDSFEKSEQKMGERAARAAIAKAGLTPDEVDVFFAGDLINQITPSGFTARSIGIPFFGLFSACSTATEALSLASLCVASGAARRALALASSHTCTAERQFRYPNEYGSQKPPYSQVTATAAGAALVAAEPAAVKVSAVTVGRVCDERISDPFQMGAAMAPAFADTVQAHFRERGVDVDYYDLVLSGDLGRVGQAIAQDLLQLQGLSLAQEQLADCGLLLYGGDKRVFSGGSGCGCAAAVGFGHIYRRISQGELRRVLLCATGALLSPVANQQKESIPAICHAVALERGE
ncbi:MAG: stage V sporulation protein AD [Clostridia bacterium]|nr:stage V sporulation protein AD [Clostridia bacterium]